MAGVLAAGPDAALAGRSGAALWRMRRNDPAVVEVITPRRVEIRGIRARRIALPTDEMTVERGIPVTTPARTLFDLAAVLTQDQLERAFNEAEIGRLTSPTSVPALLARHPGHRGSQAIRRVLAKHEAIGETFTRSELEWRLVALLDAEGLPRPQINPLTDHGELDARWPEQRLVVELDGFATHGTREAFERDRARDRALQVAGWRVVRVTWRQLTTEPDEIAAQLALLLADRRG
jgi:hypothetical protein